MSTTLVLGPIEYDNLHFKHLFGDNKTKAFIISEIVTQM